ncbi:AbrB/MazE/SpoVT family DNA-binding domain-containing protein [bacterium]|nr:AbrB/MazE/SpoVT family DNA-binding domain-containing protein [bacterium]
MTEEKKSWEVIIEEDPETGDAILPLPQEMLDEVGWKSGDNLNWIDRGDGSWAIQKVEE